MRRNLLLTLLGLLVLAIASQASAQSPQWKRSYPEPIPPSPWLETNQRFVFVAGGNLDELVKRGANIITGGTNASGIGYAGGPIVTDSNGNFIHSGNGDPIPESTLDELRARVDHAHALGVKVIGEAMRFWNSRVLILEHPEWQELTSPDAKPKTLGDQKLEAFGMTQGCWNSPFGDHYIDSMVKLAKRLDWDGYNLDGMGCWTTCYCPACREAYKKDTGKEIPYRAAKPSGSDSAVPVADNDLNDPEFRQYLKWRLDRYTHFVAKWQRRLKAEVKPEFIAMPWSTGPGRWWHWSFAPFAECSDAANRLFDAPCVELLWDFPPDQGSNLLPAFVVRYYRGLMGDRPAMMLPYFCTQGQFNMQAPQAECDLRTFTILANGCLDANGDWQQTKDYPTSHYVDLIKEREPWTAGAKSLKWAAMFVSESSRLMYGVPGKRSEVPMGSWIGSGVDTPDVAGLPPGERRLPAHMESAVGMFRAAMEAHLPLDIVTEQDVEQDGGRLSQYKVLILPNTACVSDVACEKIRQFVAGGGGLVAMQESSLCDEYGTRRQDFGLADLFGATFKATKDFSARWPNYTAITNVKFETPHEITNDPVVAQSFRVGIDLLNYIGWATEVEAKPEAMQIATRYDGLKAWPMLLLSERGKGRVAYFGGDVAQAYFLAPYQYERKLLSNAVLWAAGANQSPVVVDAPLCVQAAVYEQTKPSPRTVVHLLNEINTSANRAVPENNSPMREDVVPVAGVKVLFRQPGIQSVTLEPEHQKLDMRPVDGGVEVVVPTLKQHSMVVAERTL